VNIHSILHHFVWVNEFNKQINFISSLMMTGIITSFIGK
jgi:hypothetical protein